MKTNLITLFVLSLIILSCKSKSEQTVAVDPSLLEITKAQFESEKMEFGEASLYPFANMVYFTGSIIPNASGQAQISLPLPGKIDKIYFRPGQVIGKGSVMFEVSGNEFIDLQKDFAESSAVLQKLKSDYNRAKELYEQDIATQKDFTFAQSNYYAQNARQSALKIKLEGMELDVLKIEKGEFYSSYPVKTPITGFIASIDVKIGQYIEPQHKIAEIIDSKSFQLKLTIFERNIGSVKQGQKVSFYINGNKGVKYNATINSVGKIIMQDSKSIECFASIENSGNLNIAGNQFVEGEIYSDLDSVLSVPETAIVNSENESYLLFFEKEENDKYYFKKIKVSLGRKTDNMVELTDKLPSARILIKGVYNINVD